VPVDQVVDGVEAPPLDRSAPAARKGTGIAGALLGELAPLGRQRPLVRLRLHLDFAQAQHVWQWAADRGDEAVDRGAEVAQAARQGLADERAPGEVLFKHRPLRDLARIRVSDAALAEDRLAISRIHCLILPRDEKGLLTPAPQLRFANAGTYPGNPLVSG
jgi:hypothetical protein